MKKKNHRKLYVVLLSMLLMFCMIPAVAMGANNYACEHHPAHDDDCGGTPDKCTYVCETCMDEVKALLDQLPDMQDIRPEDAAKIGPTLSAIDALKIGLSDAAFAQIDFQKYEEAAFVLTPLPDGWCRLQLTKQMPEDASIEVSAPEFTFLNDAGESVSAMVFDTVKGVNSVSSVEVAPNVGSELVYLPVGTYTVSEEVEGDWNLSMKVNGKKDSDLTFTCEAGSGVMLVEFKNEYTPQSPTAKVVGNPEQVNGKYTGDITVELVMDDQDKEEGCAIYYTTDGTAPAVDDDGNVTNGELYDAEKKIVLTGEEGEEMVYEIDAIVTKLNSKSAPLEETFTIAIPNEKPTAEIAVDGQTWGEFNGGADFKLFYKNGKNVTIKAADTYSGVMSIEYSISDTSYANLDALNNAKPKWTLKEYSEGTKDVSEEITLPANSIKFVYAKATDAAGNTSDIISSEGIVLYSDSKAVTEELSYTKLVTLEPKSAKVELNQNTIRAIEKVVEDNDGNITSSTPLAEGTYSTDKNGNITFKKDYLESLTAGKHKLRISYNPMGVEYKGADDENKPVTTSLTLTIIDTKKNKDDSYTVDTDGDENGKDTFDKFDDGNTTYIPVDKDGDGTDDFIEVTPNEDGSYTDENGTPNDKTDDKTYIPVDIDGDGDTDRFQEVDKNKDGSFTDDNRTEGDREDDTTYIPVDIDNDGEDEFIDVEPNEDGSYTDENGTPNDKTDDTTYIPVDTDGDDKPDKFIEVTPNEDGSYTDETDNTTYIPVDDGNGGTEFIDVTPNEDGSYTDEGKKEGEDDDKTYIPVDVDADDDVDEFVEVKKDDEDNKYKDDDDGDGKFGSDGDYTYKPIDDTNDGKPDRYVTEDAIADDGHIHKVKIPATCTVSARCECGDWYGKPLGHNYGDWEKVNGVEHEKECQREGCKGAMEADHDPTLKCGPNAPSCNDCGATAANNHVWSKKWSSDKTGHWHGCEYCVAIEEEKALPHDYPNKNVGDNVSQTCTTCQYGGHITRVSPNAFEDYYIPKTLRAKYPTVDAIKEAMKAKANSGDLKVEGTWLFDAILEYSIDGGITWKTASEDYFPKKANGAYGLLPVKLPVPEGTNIDDYDYMVCHMFTSNKFEEVGGPGYIETPVVAEEEGDAECERGYISFYVQGLSPIMVAWEATTLNSNERTDTEEGNNNGEGNDDGEDNTGGIPIDDNNDGEIDRYITEDEFDKNKDKYVPIDKDGDGDIDYYVPKDKFDKGKYVPIDKDGDGDVDYYVPKNAFDKSKYAPIDKDGDGDVDHYIPNGVLTDPDGDGIYTPDGKKGPKYEGVDLDGDGIIDIYVLLTEGDGVDSGDNQDMIPWIMAMMTALTVTAVTIAGRRYRRN